MFTEEYSRSKCREIAKKTGDPELMLRSLTQYHHPGEHSIKWELSHKLESWREIKTKSDVDQRFSAFEAGISGETDLYYDQMLILYWRAFQGLQKLSIVDKSISNEEIDDYASRLLETYDRMQERARIISMRE